ncbi:homeobox protein 13-like isoform X3 [Octopus sinensis]|uniref:Homeobox protein 13-like isoform X3 n=1 Tax=Octopus sinensis TaxID=2607531 RepID=A0A7E6EGP4_9MOLL|nr:homeobox protein 13-like isoform X3 [Octopus sinensis]
MMQSAPISEELYDSLNSNQKPTQPKTKVAVEDTTIGPFGDGGGDDEDDDDDDSIRNLSSMTPCTPSVGSFDSSYATDDSPSNISPGFTFSFEPDQHLQHHHHQQQQQQQQQQQKGDEEHQQEQQQQQYHLHQYRQQQHYCRSVCRRQLFEGPQNYPHRYHNQQQQQLSHPLYFPQHIQQQQQQQQEEQHHHHLQQQFQALSIGNNTTAAIGAVGGGGGGRRRGPAVISTSLCSVESMSDYSMRERSSNDFDENDDEDDDDDDVVVGDVDDDDDVDGDLDKDDDDDEDGDNNDDVDDEDEVVGAADDDDEDDDDDVFSKDGVSGNSAFPSSQRHGVSHSRPIPIRSVARRNRTNDLNTMNHHHHHHHHNNNNHNNNNNNGSTSSYGSPSSFPMSMDHHFMANFRNNFPQHFQGPPGMSPDCCQAGNILVSCSWGSELRRTIGTQTYPMFRRTGALFGIQTACHLHNQSSIRAIISSTGRKKNFYFSFFRCSLLNPSRSRLFFLSLID